jgi:hypothetical protein
MTEVEEKAFIQGIFRALIRWNKALPTVHRMKRNGEMARRRNGEGEFTFSGSQFPRFAPSARGWMDPFARWRGGVVLLENPEKKPGNPPRQHPPF